MECGDGLAFLIINSDEIGEARLLQDFPHEIACLAKAHFTFSRLGQFRSNKDAPQTRAADKCHVLQIDDQLGSPCAYNLIEVIHDTPRHRAIKTAR